MHKRMLLDGLAAGMMLVKFQFSDAKAVWKAHHDFRKMKKTTFKTKRAHEQHIAIKHQHNEILMKNLVWLHFTGKIKKFSELKKNETSITQT
jgi:hypothetical protein